MKKILFTLGMLINLTVCYSQIKANEKLIYAASYNMSGLMTQLAQVSIETEMIHTSKKTFLHLSLQATTFSKWDSFFKIRDLYESYVDPTTLKPSLYKRSINEGGYVKTEKYVFKSDGVSINSTSKINKRAEINRVFTVGNTTQDVVTLLFKLRTINFNNFKIGQIKSFTIVFDEKEFPISVKYMGKEKVSAGNLGIKECYIISIAAKTNVLKGKDKNLVWLTADTKKIPVQVKFSIPVGVGQLKLSNASGI